MKSLKRLAGEMSPGRRAFFCKLGQGTLFGAAAGQAYALLRSLVPNVLYEHPQKFKIGTPGDFSEGVTFLEDRRIYVFRNQNTFHVMSATCTHLGCTVARSKEGFACPCHGSRFDQRGNVVGGPAPRPLPWLEVSRAANGELIVNADAEVEEGTRYRV